MNTALKRNILSFIFMISGGFLAGIINGLFGTGGGIITVYSLSHIPYFKGLFGKKDVFAMTLISSFFMSLSSAFLNICSGNIAFSDVIPYALPAFIGGAAGALILDKIKVSFLSKLFSVIVIYAGITLFTR